MPTKKIVFLLGTLIVATLLLVACAGPAGETGPAGPMGPAGPAGPQGPQGPAGVSPTLEPAAFSVSTETCVICHPDVGEETHQATYDELYQDGVIQVNDLAYTFSASPDTTTITFKMTNAGAPFDGSQADSLGIYFVPFDGTNFQFAQAGTRLSLKGKLSYDGNGVTTSTLVEKAPDADGYVDYTDLRGVNGLIVLYGRDETVATIPNSRITQNKYPFAAILETGAGVDYVSPANNAGCEKCHTTPYLKHGYIYAEINHDPSTDFYTCKGCHLDNGDGGHFEFQLLVDNPTLAAAFLAGEVELTPEQLAQYGYKTRLMNDVHMSHAMEFLYPQSMSNCATCHEGKLDMILTDANFKLETCKSCHPVTGPEEGTQANRAPALASVMPHDITNAECNSCHMEGGIGPVFSSIHTGYNDVIYADNAGTKYSEVFSTTIDTADFADNKLTIDFSVTKNGDLTEFMPADVVPTLMVGLYGYDTKDFIVSPHGRDADNNRFLEFLIDGQTTNPRFNVVSAANGSWEVTVDLSMWADMIADGSVKRAEIAVMPLLAKVVGEIDSHENGETDDTSFALNAPSRTFDLTANAFDDGFYSEIVSVSEGCNSCHDALATTFHTPDRGGNIVVCRMCHVTTSGGSHLEMQSRSIDSYVHAIHSFQAFDPGDIDFTDPVQTMEYEHHIESPYPKHGITDCESCHNEGMFNVPNQSESLPGLLSAADTLTKDRKIGAVPSYVTGPASRACGGCHRAMFINEDDADGLNAFNLHASAGGYMVEVDSDTASSVLDTVIKTIMSFFK